MADALRAARRELSSTFEAVPRASGGVVFASGTFAHASRELAEEVARAWPGVPALVVPGAGVLTQDGEVEGGNAIAGALWSGGRARVVRQAAATPAEAGEALAESIAAELGARAGTVLLFAGSDGLEPGALEAIGRAAPLATIAGAGAAAASVIAVDPSSEPRPGSPAALVLTGLTPPIVDASPACRVLTPFFAVDEALSGMVLRLGGRTALEQLSECGPRLRAAGRQPVVFAALSAEAENAEPERFLLRPLRGIDPQRGGVLIGSDVRRGMRMAFALRDPDAARADLERMVRRVERQAQGAAHRFGLYLGCAGRGQGLYGAPDVDVRILRRRFPDLPFAGMHSSFEIASWGPGQPRLQLFTGVFCLFRSLS